MDETKKRRQVVEMVKPSVVPEFKPSLNIDSRDIEIVKDLKIGDKVKIIATGIVTQLSKRDNYEGEKKKEYYEASLELSDIKVDETKGDEKVVEKKDKDDRLVEILQGKKTETP